MIPKIIHYCWFGGNQLPESAKQYIATWKKYCSDYEIKEWNESNFDVTQNQYCQEAYEAKKWAFVSDYARLRILYDYGGIYMDTDVEVCKPLDHLASYGFWSGFESESQIQTGTIASCRDNELLRYLLSYYDDKHFKNKDGSYDTTTNVVTISKMIKAKYAIQLNNTLQIFGDNNAIFPFEYFCAKSTIDGKVKQTENTYTIHHFAGSWLTPYQVVRHKIKIFLVKVFGERFVEYLKILMNKIRIYI